MIELHTWNTPNGRKISVALEEMGLPYTVKTVNIGKGEQFDPDFLAFSPNNRIPAIIDPDGPGGQPITVFESGAILLYLGGEDRQVPARRPAGPGAGAGMADVADGRLRPDARPGAPLPDAARWAGQGLRREALRRGDASGSTACSTAGWRGANTSPPLHLVRATGHRRTLAAAAGWRPA